MVTRDDPGQDELAFSARLLFTLRMYICTYTYMWAKQGYIPLMKMLLHLFIINWPHQHIKIRTIKESIVCVSQKAVSNKYSKVWTNIHFAIIWIQK